MSCVISASNTAQLMDSFQGTPANGAGRDPVIDAAGQRSAF